MNSLSIYFSGPSFNNQERNSITSIRDKLIEKDFIESVFVSSSDGLESYYMNYFANKDKKSLEFGENFYKVNLLSLALDFYQMLNSDVCVALLNGRVPDESTIVKMGIAFGNGIPVLLYKVDTRVLFSHGDNGMILGLNREFMVVTKYKKLLEKIKSHSKNNTIDKNQIIKNREDRLPPFNRLLYKLGKVINKNYKEIFVENLQSDREYPGLIPIYDEQEYREIKSKLSNYNEKFNKNLIINTEIQGGNEKVYCSGALFCPTELRDMKEISDALAHTNYRTFLPQRDGAEPYVMGSARNPFAGSPIAKPITKLLGRAVFAIDVKAIVECELFIVNLNGRTPDDGAMAELGIAFALGKPIVLFKSDIRQFYIRDIHPTLLSVGYLFDIATDFKELLNKLMRVNLFINSLGENTYLKNIPNNLPNTLKDLMEKGRKWESRLCYKKPEFQMDLTDE